MSRLPFIATRRALMLLGIVLAGAGGTTATAQTIAPVLLELTSARRLVSVTMTNGSARTMTYQAQAVAWSQADGADRLAETGDLLVVPPVADIAPGGTQIFRVTSRRPPPAQETAYRLIFEDVTEDTAPPPEGGAIVRLQFRHSLPVFFGPASPRAAGGLRLTACPDTAAPCVRLYNDGGRRVRVAQLGAQRDGWRSELKAPGTVLAGSWRQWTFDSAPPPGTKPVKVTAVTSAGDVAIELPAAR